MPHRVEYYDGGQRARVIVDLDGASLDADANPIGSEWQTLKNMFADLPGVLRKRGGVTNAGSNSNDLNAASGALSFHDGLKVSGATYRPYVGSYLDSGSVSHVVQVANTAAEGVLSGASLSVPVSKCPTVDGWLIVAGRQAASSYNSNQAGIAAIYGGGIGTTVYSTGTVTATSGSTSITGSGTTWTSAMEGCLFRATSDTYQYAYYRVVKVVSGTSLTLDRAYAGSATGASLAYVLVDAWEFVAPVAGPWGTTDTRPRFKVAAGCWGRLVTASTREAGSATAVTDATPVYKSRIRWSGVLGSDDGTGGATGIYAWDANGYLDLSARFGEVLALVPSSDYVAAFQESGLTIIRGAPVFDGAGSLDISETHPGVAINGGFAFEATPQGVFFFDKNVGPCLYDGSRVIRLGDKRVTRTMLSSDIKYVGYYDGKVLFTGDTTVAGYVLDTATGQWGQHTFPVALKCLIAGRVENDEDIVALGNGVRVVNVANMFDQPGASRVDWTGDAIVADMKTGKIGDSLTLVRPERMFVTYRCVDGDGSSNPYVAVTVSTGLPDTSDSAHLHTTASTDVVETTDVETREFVLNLDRDPMVQVRLLQVNAASKLEIYSVVLDCSVEGVGASS